MEYPFKFSEMLLTDKVLDVLGFSEYWGDSGDSGSRCLYLDGIIGDEKYTENGKNEYPRYYIHVIDEKDDECDGYCTPAKYCPERITDKDFSCMYFLHEMYEDILSRRTPEEIEVFQELLKKNNMWIYIESYLKYK